IADIVSRIFISPSFLFFYITSIIAEIKKNRGECVDLFFHNSRLGIVALILKLLFNVRVFFFIDNNESNLSKQQAVLANGFFEKIFRYYDYILIKISEFFVKKISSHLFFITKNDANAFKLNADVKYSIIPVCVDDLYEKEIINRKPACLFTASFTFSPNVLALKRLLKLAEYYPTIDFIVAGRGLSKYIYLNNLKNVKFICSPSEQYMRELFKTCKGYITLVEDGSGMKTKIAEALSAGMYIYSSWHSAIGYEAVIDSGCIYVYKDMITDFNTWYSNLSEYDPYLSIKAYRNNYTYSHAGDILNAACR
ncbi:glycosyltransferase family 1 protein, partial [Escherichia coli]|nr:glycosyltransferase family 1 protein [Escherichia coli]